MKNLLDILLLSSIITLSVAKAENLPKYDCNLFEYSSSEVLSKQFYYQIGDRGHFEMVGNLRADVNDFEGKFVLKLHGITHDMRHPYSHSTTIGYPESLETVLNAPGPENVVGILSCRKQH
jgi:hypothetical protein